MTENAEHAPNASDDAQHPMAHVMSLQMLLGVYAALIVLTVITVTAATPQFDFGGWNLWIAMGIATAKASLVALYFMHLRYDNPFNGIIFITALLFLGIFLSITLLDVTGYQPEIQSFQEAQP